MATITFSDIYHILAYIQESHGKQTFRWPGFLFPAKFNGLANTSGFTVSGQHQQRLELESARTIHPEQNI